MSAPDRARKGPWIHRFLVRFFTVCLSVLVFWLLGFFMDDIGDWPGPDYRQVEASVLDPKILADETTLATQVADTEREISEHRARQSILRDSTQSSRETMGQLLEIQRLGFQKNVTPSAEEQKALAESESLFLANQKKYQTINEEIARLDEHLRGLQQQSRDVQQRRNDGQLAVTREFEILQQAHNLKVAFVKLAALAPFLIAAAAIFLRWRATLYSPMIYAFGVAVLAKIALVMHEYFPSRYFKYVLILTCLAVVVRSLMLLLRTIAHPKTEWLLNQAREAYEAFLCPVCEHPIRRGPLKYLSWTRRSLRKLNIAAGEHWPDEPYSCPVCATKLYEECSSCHGVRHSLLPACAKCGTRHDPPAT